MKILTSMKALFFILTVFFSSVGYGQSNITLSTGLSRVNLSYSKSITANQKHWAEISFIVNSSNTGEYLVFNNLTIYQFEAVYEYSVFGPGKNDLLLGLGYRTPRGDRQGYTEYGMISVPITYEYRFENKPVILSFRLSSLIKHDYTAVPAFGISFVL